MRRAASPPRMRMPLEKTRRSPRVRELAGDEAVAGEEEGQAREIRERRVGGEDQDEHGDGLDLVVEETAAEDLAGELGDHRLLLARHDAEVVGKEGDAQEQGDEDDAQPDQDRPRVPRLGGLEAPDAVGHRLHAGERGAAGGEGAQDEEEASRPACSPPRSRGAAAPASRTRASSGRSRSRACPPKLDHEEIGGRGEELAGLAEPAQVGQR